MSEKFDSFTEAMLRQIGEGLDLSYGELVADWTRLRSALQANDRRPATPLRYFALPNELAVLGGAERIGLATGADEVWSRPPVGEAPKLLWSRPSLSERPANS